MSVSICLLPCFGTSASLVLFHLLGLASALFRPSSEEQECCCSPRVCREALEYGHPVAHALRCPKNFLFIHTLGVCNMLWHIKKIEMLMLAKYGNCVQNVMDLLVNVFSNSRSNKYSWWIKTTRLLFLVFQTGDEVCWKNTLVNNSV